MIFINELIKAFCKCTTIAIFAVLLILNGVLLYINETKQTLEYTPEQYKAAYQTLEGLDTHAAFKQISQKKTELELIQRLSFGEDISQENCNAEELLKSYKNKDYLEFTNDIYPEIELTDRLFEEISACENYDSYLENIDSTARKMTGISLFADPDSFSYKNIARTPADFAHLKGSKLTAAPSKGVSMATGFLATDLIAILMIMTVVVTIVTREKELDQITLARTTFKGRMPLGIAKLFTCFAAAMAAEILLYAVNFAVSYFTYGFGNLSRQIQSVYEFNGSNLKISVLQYFALFLAAKLAVYCVFAAIIYLVTVVSNTAVKVYGALMITIAAEAVLYYTIPSTSYLCPLKYINSCIRQHKRSFCKLSQSQPFRKTCQLYGCICQLGVGIADCDFHTLCTDIFKAKGDKKPHKKIQSCKVQHFQGQDDKPLFARVLQGLYRRKGSADFDSICSHHRSFIFSYQRELFVSRRGLLQAVYA